MPDASPRRTSPRILRIASTGPLPRRASFWKCTSGIGDPGGESDDADVSEREAGDSGGANGYAAAWVVGGGGLECEGRAMTVVVEEVVVEIVVEIDDESGAACLYRGVLQVLKEGG